MTVTRQPGWKYRSGLCGCLCHELSENPHNGMGIPVHKDKCICNGGTGWMDILTGLEESEPYTGDEPWWEVGNQ